MKRLGWRSSLGLLAIALAFSVTFSGYLVLDRYRPEIIPAPLRLGPAPGEIAIWLRVYDENGALLAEKRSESLTQHFLELMGNCMDGFGSSGGNNIGLVSGSQTGCVTTGIPFDLSAPSSEVDCGIVVGTGTTAEQVAQTSLSSQVANGSGSGQLNYGSQTVNLISVSGGTTTLTITRPFTNNSGATVTVNEVGVYQIANPTVGCTSSTTNTQVMMSLRDLLTFAITNTNTATVQIDFTTTV